MFHYVARRKQMVKFSFFFFFFQSNSFSFVVFVHAYGKKKRKNFESDTINFRIWTSLDERKSRIFFLRESKKKQSFCHLSFFRSLSYRYFYSNDENLEKLQDISVPNR